MRAYGMAQHQATIWRQLFPLNGFLSRTTRPISTQRGKKHVWGMGIQMCSNKGAGPFWGPIRGKIGKLSIFKNRLLMNHLPVCIDT